MKKLIIASACSLAVVGAAFGQGAVNWGSISFANYTAQTNTVTYSSYAGGGATGLAGGAVGNAGGTSANGAGYYYELLIGAVWNGSAASVPTTYAGLATWADSGLGATNSNTAGRVTVENANTAATVTQLSATVSNSVVLVGWSGNLGTTWSAALGNMEAGTWTGNAFFGVSAEGVIEASALPASQGNNVFGNTAQTYGTPIQSTLTQLYLLPVPEPGTMALAALGGASLLLFRRKK